jgi:GNAT superfamily N-acetyltransferase
VIVAILIKILRADDIDLLSNLAPGTFDDPLDPGATATFLADDRHHLAVAVDDRQVVGVASAVHYVHPDKPRPELWINEVGVAATHRGKGVGKAILAALLELGRELGCTEAWILTNRKNAPALRLYASLGGEEGPSDDVVITFKLPGKTPADQ